MNPESLNRRILVAGLLAAILAAGAARAGNVASGDHAFVGGGDGNTASGSFAIIGGGRTNTASGTLANINGGRDNVAKAKNATIAGGFQNNAVGVGTYIGGGASNLASNQYATVAGGALNTANRNYATVAGGLSNTASGQYATLGGGHQNTASDDSATVGGGLQNVANGPWCTVGGGYKNTASYVTSTVGGGSSNIASGQDSAVPGGSLCVAGGAVSFAAGYRAHAPFEGDFVWADLQFADFSATAANQFAIRAQGGVVLDPTTRLFFGNQTRQMLNLYGTGFAMGIQTDVEYCRTGSEFYWFKGGAHSDTHGDPGPGGVVQMRLDDPGNLTVTGSVCAQNVACVSDRNLKERFEPVDAQQVLALVAALSIQRWSYKRDAGSRHLGPVAQDFHAAFGLGEDDRHITTLDEGGVALAAIQGLYQVVKDREARIDQLEKRLADLEAQLAKISR